MAAVAQRHLQAHNAVAAQGATIAHLQKEMDKNKAHLQKEIDELRALLIAQSRKLAAKE